MRKVNPCNKDGEITKYNVCGSIYHWTKSCPDSYENQLKTKDEINITLIGECMDILLGKTPNITLLGSGCTKTVCSKTWLNYYLESLSSEELNNIKCERIETIFKFGNGKVCHSIEQITIQVVVVVQNVLVTTEIIKNDIPLLLSKDRMKKANTYIDFANDTIVI